MLFHRQGWLVVRNSRCDQAYCAVTEVDEPQRILKNEVFVPVVANLEEGCGFAERRSLRHVSV